MPGCQMVQTLNGFQNLYKKSGLGMFLQRDSNTEHQNLEPIQNLNVLKIGIGMVRTQPPFESRTGS